VPRYVALGVTTLKIQGREYPAPLIGELTKIYRTLMDQIAAGQADLPAARAALDPVLAARDGCRSAKTQALHGRLLSRMAAAGDGQSSDWDPGAEEARLRGAEPSAQAKGR
jgi:collagenase-like PrtC family protease